MIYLVVSIKYRHVTDRQTSCDSIVRAMHIYVSRGKNKCIEDNTKAAAHQKPNCIKKTKKYNTAKNDFQYGGWNSYTFQCGTWLWDNMPLNSPKRPPCWNSTTGFDFDHITADDMSFCTSLRNFIQTGSPSTEKNDVISIFKMADLRHLGF